MGDISSDVIDKITLFQKRCINCGGTCKREIHHRVFRSEGEIGMRNHLLDIKDTYFKSYGRELEVWDSIHDIQNLCILCARCHMSLHRGSEDLRQKVRNSFTCPRSGFNIPFHKIKSLY